MVKETISTLWVACIMKISTDIKNKFDSEPVYNKNYLKTKIKSYDNEVTDFYNKKFLN